MLNQIYIQDIVAIAKEAGKILKKYKVNNYLKHKYNKENSLNQWFKVRSEL